MAISAEIRQELDDAEDGLRQARRRLTNATTNYADAGAKLQKAREDLEIAEVAWNMILEKIKESAR